jgi:4-hydroxybenzoate polyprenyltransferase
MMSSNGEQKPGSVGEPAKVSVKSEPKPAAKPTMKPAVKPRATKANTKPAAKSATAKSIATKSTAAKSVAVKNPVVKTATGNKTTVSTAIEPKGSASKSAVPKVADKAKPSRARAKPATANPTTAQPKILVSAEQVAVAQSVTAAVQTNSKESSPSSPNASPARAPKRAQKSAATPNNRSQRLLVYAQLMRLHRPIGILLLLWPTLWSLWLAAGGFPRWELLVIFTLGVVLMRSAGCVINDFADRKIDAHVARTKTRPLATGSVSSREALILFAVLCLLAFGLVLLTNTLTIQLSLGGLLLAFCYPFMKRHTHLPQVVLGAAFAWSIPMAFAAQSGVLAQEMWLIYLAVVLWTVVYDTFYAMVDRDDDKRIGVKSTAILFGEQDRFITGFLQALTLYALVLVGGRFELGSIYYASLAVAAGFFIYQQYLIRFREREACFKAFLNNHWVGMVVFIGIVADLALKTPH